MKEKFSLYRPAAAAFITMMAMALTSSTLGFFLEPVCAHLGISRGSFSFIFSLLTVASALTNPLQGIYAGRKGVRGILAISGVWGFGCLTAMSFSANLWTLYGTAFLLGFFGTNCLTLCANVIVQNSYEPGKASSILGIVMAGSGAGGMIFNLLIPGVMAAASWQRAMSVMGLCWMVALLTAAVLLGREKLPELRTFAAVRGLGMTRAEAVRSPKFYMLIALIVIIDIACGIQQQQPSLLGSYGIQRTAVSLMISVQTAALALGKIGQGILYGRFGVRRGGITMLAIFAAAFLVLLIPALVWPGLILMALGLGIYTTLLPLVTRQVFGTREYAAIWGLLATCGSVGTIVANPLWGGTYDLTGSYTPALVAVPLLLAAGALILNSLLKGKR